MSNNRRNFYKKKPPEEKYNPPFPNEILTEPVTSMQFRNPGTLTLLTGANINTVGDVVSRREKDFYKILTFNKKNLLDVTNAVKAKGLFLRPAPAPKETPTAEGGAEQPQERPGKQTRKPESNRQGREPREGAAEGRNRDRQPQSQGNRQQNGKNQSRNERNDRGGRGDRQNNDRRDRGRGGKVDSSYVSETEVKRQRPAPVRPEKAPADIYVKVNKNDKWGFSDRSGKITVQPEYDEVYTYHEDLCCVEKDGRCGFINRSGEEVVPIEYELAFSFSEGYACVYKNGKCGYINAQNEIVVELKYDAGTSVVEGNCRVKKDGKWGELHLDDVKNVRWIV